MGLPGCELDVQVLWDAVLLVGEVAVQVGVIGLTELAVVGTTWAVGLFLTGLIDPGERKGARV